MRRRFIFSRQGCKLTDENKGIADIEFSDLYLDPNDIAWYKRSSGDRNSSQLTGRAAEEAVIFREHIQQHLTGIDFTTTWNNERFRVRRIEALDGDVFVCRKITKKIVPFCDLGLQSQLVEALLSKDFNRGGVVLFTGHAGAGKSTSLSSWLVARLKQFGGTAWTVENPIEVVTHGRHVGENGVVGSCYQTEVHDDERFGASIQGILRAAPNMIMVGEIREANAAYQSLLAGTSGHLVGATMHANSLVAALERLTGFLGEVRPSGSMFSFLSEAVAAIVHQSLVRTVVNGVERVNLRASQLVITGSKNSTAIKSHLREGDFALLASEIERQQRVLTSSDVQTGGISALLGRI